MNSALKFLKRFSISAALLFIFISCSQQNKNDYSQKLNVLSDFNTYKEIANKNPDNVLIDIEKLIPGIVLDIRYASKNNFTHEQIYQSAKAFLRKPVAEALLKISEELKTEGLGLKIFDAYRPYAATVKFYEIYPDTNFVAAPWKGSIHNRACAVDLTLIDLETGKELKMPTPFDDFSIKASQSYNDLTNEELQNRELLKNIMTKYGFDLYEYEWWHYNYQGWESYQLLNIPFELLD